MGRISSFIASILLFLSFSFGVNGCPFCHPEVIAKQRVLEGQFFNVLLDLGPRVFGHLLVTPKRHVLKAQELSKDEWAELGEIIGKIARVFSEFLETERYVILEKNGCDAFQEVPHIHFHFFPVHAESWSDIFDIVPDRLTDIALEEQVLLFRSILVPPQRVAQKRDACTPRLSALRKTGF